MRWHANFKRLGVLPFGGRDLMAQPAWLFQAFERIEMTIAEIQRSHMERLSV